MRKSDGDSDKPKKKEYAGKVVFNTNVGFNMHLLASYRTFFGRREGIFSDAYDQFVALLARRIRDDMQNVIIIEGETGSGKSALALNICLDLSRRLNCEFDLETDYIYSASDLWNKLKQEDANPISLIDEASITLASSNAMQKSDKQILALFDTMRSRHWTTVLVAPSHMRINAAVIRDHVEFKLRCTPENKPLLPGFGRGFFECRRAVKSEFKKEEPEWLMMYAGIFGDYPPILRNEYLNLKAVRQDELMRRYVNRAKTDEAKEDKEFKKYNPKADPKGEW